MDLVIEKSIRENTSPVILARVLDSTGEAADADSFASCSYSVYQFDGDLLTSGSLVVGDVIEDALVTPSTDSRWRKDQTGYNFLWQISAALLSLSGRATYWIEVVFVDASGAAIPVLVKLKQYPLRSL